MHVVRPPWDDREVARREVPVELGHVGPHLEPVVGRQRRWVDAGPGDHDHPQARDSCPGLGKRGDQSAQEVASHAGPAGAGEAERRFGRLGPMSAEELSTLVGLSFLGGEEMILLGDASFSRSVHAALRWLADAIRQLEKA